MSDRRTFGTTRIGTAAVVTIVSALALTLAACSDDSTEPDAVAAPDATAASSTTTVAPESATETADAFLAAYGAFDTDRALSYLTEDAVATGSGSAGEWGSEDAFRLEQAMEEAQGVEQMFKGCEEQGETAEGTAVRCDFDLHAFRSEEAGLGPFTDNWWDLVVRDGKVASAGVTWSFLTNGFSDDVWVPFQSWVASTYPQDLGVMYVGGFVAVNEESIALWEQRTKEWAETMQAS
jgi:hypothetical protein